MKPIRTNGRVPVNERRGKPGCAPVADAGGSMGLCIFQPPVRLAVPKLIVLLREFIAPV